MKIFLTTVAGCSTRFTQSINKKIPKSIYYKNVPQSTLLYRMVNTVSNYDKIVIVGGYCCNLLEEYINQVFSSKIKDKICLVYNDKFDLYGSGWSLFKGLVLVLDQKLMKYCLPKVIYILVKANLV